MFQLPRGMDVGPRSKLSCRAWPCLLVAVARLAGRRCSWLACGLGGSFSVPFARAPTQGPVFLAQASLDCLGLRVGGPPGCVRRDGSGGWRSPVSRGDHTGGRDCALLPPTIAFWARRQVPKAVTDRTVGSVRDGWPCASGGVFSFPRAIAAASTSTNGQTLSRIESTRYPLTPDVLVHSMLLPWYGWTC